MRAGFRANRQGREAAVIKFHEGPHGAASLARDAAVDPEIRRETLGHTLMRR